MQRNMRPHAACIGSGRHDAVREHPALNVCAFRLPVLPDPLLCVLHVRAPVPRLIHRYLTILVTFFHVES